MVSFSLFSRILDPYFENGNDTTTQKRRRKQHNPKGGRGKQHHTRERNTPTKKDRRDCHSALPCFTFPAFSGVVLSPLVWCCVSPPTKNNQTFFLRNSNIFKCKIQFGTAFCLNMYFLICEIRTSRGKGKIRTKKRPEHIC